jgi:hypothetical protein
MKELDERCCTAGLQREWGAVFHDLDRLQSVEITKDGKQMTLRTPAAGLTGPFFKVARVALALSVRDTQAT